MARSLFRKIGDEPWQNVGIRLLHQFREIMSEQDILATATRLARIRRGPEIRFEVREVTLRHLCTREHEGEWRDLGSANGLLALSGYETQPEQEEDCITVLRDEAHGHLAVDRRPAYEFRDVPDGTEEPTHE